MTTKIRITTAIATGAVLLNALAPIAFADEVLVTGNGAFSDNKVKLESTNTTVVDQRNDAHVTNDIDANASTGGNSASYNTGGDNRIVTGDATTKVDVSTDVNLNKANIDCCAKDNLGVKISGNGAYSDNKVKVYDDNFTSVSQNNDAYIRNDVDAKANTGKNDSSFNTGGDSVIVTGDARTIVDVSNRANANIAEIGGGHEGEGPHHGDSWKGSEVEITGNGAFSDNKAKLNLNSAVVLDQYNDARIHNDVDANSNTGKNDATFNTGGETAIVTGDAKTWVGVDNTVNFNKASVDCDCVLEDLKVKIAGNGAESYNKIKAYTDNELFNSQDNYADLDNYVDGNAKTGYNDVSFGTGSVHGDPLIITGDAKSSTDVSNSGNVNLFNEGVRFHLPGDWEVDTNFDLSGLLGYLHLG